MTADEKFVREHWIRVEMYWLPAFKPRRFRVEMCYDAIMVWALTKKDALRAAAAFTRARLVEIADVEEEIAWLKRKCMILPNYIQPRILSREQAALAELQRGMVSQRKAATAAKEK